MSINKNELTKELIQKAMACKTAEEELSDFELDSEALTKVAGGGCYTECNSERYHCHSKQRSS